VIGYEQDRSNHSSGRRAETFAIVVSPGWRGVDLDASDDDFAAVARAHGAMLCARFHDTIDGTPVGASVICATIPQADLRLDACGSAEALVRQMIGGEPRITANDADIVDLPSGPALRVHSHPEITVDETLVQTDNVQYFLPVPGRDAVLVVTFSTPSLPYAEAFGQVFAGMAASIEWIW
jgi:hypothetical protein